MDMYQMNRQGFRPYTHTCGMNGQQSKMGAFRENTNFESACGRRQEQMCDRRPMPECSAGTERTMSPEKKDCDCIMPGTKSKDAEMYTHLQHLVPAMAYVPCQEFTTTFDLNYALNVGTIFPQLCKPFCGKRGGCR